MKDVIVIKRRRNYEWQVRDQDGALLMRGRERTRPAARYQGYRALFMMLAVGPPRPIEPRRPKVRPEQQSTRKTAPDLAHLQRPARPFTLD
ncbi:hypothetical protein J6524_28430 [Bradyrhizobium sp. WSM 1738]|uniref:hypothetical protein n=1 Tax=Bradyrhizobium hereditatis TaxID=2821405 RepID=UPI001CE3A101|nr:hypothetical protein [Bradyrhizobium hereditatis]MCA6118776.1 hypothetical protein [Bradyrhizobium hereditatis]